MSRALQTLLGVLIVCLLIVGPVAYALQAQTDFRGFKVVHEGVLYRSGQMTLAGLKRIVHDHGIRTVVSLRDAAVIGQTPPDLEEERYCRDHEISFYRLPPQPWWARVGPAPVEPNVRKFCDIMNDPDNYPVLVHCFAGIHRTGAYCAIYRMEHEGWSNERAIEEVKACGYENLDIEWDILGYLEHYRPAWKGTIEEPAPEIHKVKKPRTRKKMTR